MPEGRAFNPTINPEAAASLPAVQENPAEFLENVVFGEPQSGKGGRIVFKSSDPSRKVIELRPESVKPEPGRTYRVRIVRDTNPNDPTKGKFEAVIVPGELEQMTEEKWRQLDDELNAAEVAIERLKEVGRRMGATGATAPETPLTVAQQYLSKAAQRQSVAVPKLVEQLAGGNAGEPLKALLALRQRAYWTALRDITQLNEKLDELVHAEIELLTGQENRTFDGSRLSEEAAAALEMIRADIADARSVARSLPSHDPEAFMAVHGRDLLRMRESVRERGIVFTPYVEEMAERVYTNAILGQPTLIHGHLGSGKTELACLVARRFMADKEPLIVSGSKHTSPEDFFGYQVLKVSKTSLEEGAVLRADVTRDFEQWKTEHAQRLAGMGGAEREAEERRQHDTILQIALRRIGNGTLSENIIGPLHRAMREGRPVIIDEINAIPHEVLIALNYALAKRPGNPATDLNGEKFTVAPGYCVIGTANLNIGEQHLYVGRQDLDPAFLSRFDIIEYDYLPQHIDRPLEDDVTPEDAAQGRQLYQAMLSLLIDERGTTNLPEGSDKKLWALAKLARVTQLSFSGKLTDSQFFFTQNGVARDDYHLQQTPMSMRHLRRVLEGWRDSGYRYELDWFVWDKFISQYTEPTDRAYLYQIFRNNGFFDGVGWPTASELDFGSDGIVPSFDIKPPENPSRPRVYTALRGTVQMAYGKAPPRTQWPAKPAEYITSPTLTAAERVAQESGFTVERVVPFEAGAAGAPWHQELAALHVTANPDADIRERFKSQGPRKAVYVSLTREMTAQELGDEIEEAGYRGMTLTEFIAAAKARQVSHIDAPVVLLGSRWHDGLNRYEYARIQPTLTNGESFLHNNHPETMLGVGTLFAIVKRDPKDVEGPHELQ